MSTRHTLCTMGGLAAQLCPRLYDSLPHSEKWFWWFFKTGTLLAGRTCLFQKNLEGRQGYPFWFNIHSATQEAKKKKKLSGGLVSSSGSPRNSLQGQLQGKQARSLPLAALADPAPPWTSRPPGRLCSVSRGHVCHQVSMHLHA